MEILGHVIGFIALALFVWSYQLHEKKKLIVVQTVGTALMCLQYILIGAYSGFALNIVCLIRNGLYYRRDLRGKRGIVLPLILAAIMVVLSVFAWDGLHSILILAGLAINTVCMGIFDTQNLRKSVVLTCSLNAVYNAIAGAPFAVINESFSVVSSIIGIIRANRSKAAQKS